MADPPPRPLRLPSPDASFHLTADERSRTIFDADAVERLLALIDPEFRPRIMRHFVQPLPGEVEPGERIGWLVELLDPQTDRTDPILQPLLEDAYVPLWAELSDEFVYDPDCNPYPGRERERRRREAERTNAEARDPSP